MVTRSNSRRRRPSSAIGPRGFWFSGWIRERFKILQSRWWRDGLSWLSYFYNKTFLTYLGDSSGCHSIRESSGVSSTWRFTSRHMPCWRDWGREQDFLDPGHCQTVKPGDPRSVLPPTAGAYRIKSVLSFLALPEFPSVCQHHKYDGPVGLEWPWRFCFVTGDRMYAVLQPTSKSILILICQFSELLPPLHSTRFVSTWPVHGFGVESEPVFSSCFPIGVRP